MAKVQAVDEQCPVELGLNILSGKWKLKILWHLSKGTIRFNELQRLLGNITTKTLTEQLRELEEQGIILRTVFPEVPPRVEYSLSEIGCTLKPIFVGIPDRSFPIRTVHLRSVSGCGLFRLMNIQPSEGLPGKQFSG